MVENYVSVETVIAKVIRDIGEQGNYRYSSIKEWIGEIALKTSFSQTMVRGYAKIPITNHRANMPCNLIRTICITYNGCKLRYGQDIRHHFTGRNVSIPQEETTNNRYFASNYDLIYKYDSEGKLIETLSNNEIVNNMYPVNGGESTEDYYYYIEGDWYKFNIEEGEVEVDYMALYTDNSGFPLIPDNTYLLEAIQYYVLMKLLGSGFTHSLWTGANGYLTVKRLYEEQLERAKGTIYYPSAEQMYSYAAAYNKLMPNFHQQDKYKHNIEGLSNEPNPAL